MSSVHVCGTVTFGDMPSIPPKLYPNIRVIDDLPVAGMTVQRETANDLFIVKKTSGENTCDPASESCTDWLLRVDGVLDSDLVGVVAPLTNNQYVNLELRNTAGASYYPESVFAPELFNYGSFQFGQYEHEDGSNYFVRVWNNCAITLVASTAEGTGPTTSATSFWDNGLYRQIASTTNDLGSLRQEVSLYNAAFGNALEKLRKRQMKVAARPEVYTKIASWNDWKVALGSVAPFVYDFHTGISYYRDVVDGGGVLRRYVSQTENDGLLAMPLDDNSTAQNAIAVHMLDRQVRAERTGSLTARVQNTGATPLKEMTFAMLVRFNEARPNGNGPMSLASSSLANDGIGIVGTRMRARIEGTIYDSDNLSDATLNQWVPYRVTFTPGSNDIIMQRGTETGVIANGMTHLTTNPSYISLFGWGGQTSDKIDYHFFTAFPTVNNGSLITNTMAMLQLRADELNAAGI